MFVFILEKYKVSLSITKPSLIPFCKAFLLPLNLSPTIAFFPSLSLNLKSVLSPLITTLFLYFLGSFSNTTAIF